MIPGKVESTKVALEAIAENPGHFSSAVVGQAARNALELLNEPVQYAEALEAPARELLFLYDWRPVLAKEEAASLDENGGNAEDRKNVARRLREYGERKKAGWIALRAALAKNPTDKAVRVGAEAAGSSCDPVNVHARIAEIDAARDAIPVGGALEPDAAARWDEVQNIARAVAMRDDPPNAVESALCWAVTKLRQWPNEDLSIRYEATK